MGAVGEDGKGEDVALNYPETPKTGKQLNQTPTAPLSKLHGVGVTASGVPKGRKRISSESQSRVQTLFDHIPKPSNRTTLFETPSPGLWETSPHPIFYTLGIKFAFGKISGSNRRCVALLDGIKDFITGYVTPEGTEFRYEFAQSLKMNLKFLRRCRPFAVAMDNAVAHIHSVFHTGGVNEDGEGILDVSAQEKRQESEIREDILSALDDYKDLIEKAQEAVIENSESKINSGDRILIYGYSEVVWKALLKAAGNGKSFSIVVIEGRPLEEQKKGQGLDIIASFVESKLDKYLTSVTYSSVNGLSNALPSVTKVILGAHALLTNGAVLAHAGSAQIALMATIHNIPVLACCETYKFCDKSPTDSFYHNELSPNFGSLLISVTKEDESGPELVKVPSSEDQRQKTSLITPVIKYDVTPPELVTAVITDVDILPCTSVPVVLRIQENRKRPSAVSSKTPF